MIIYLLIIIGNINAITHRFETKAECEIARNEFEKPTYFECLKAYEPVEEINSELMDEDEK